MSALLNLSSTVNAETLGGSKQRPATLVVQPATDLIGSKSLPLHQTLKVALEQVTTGVIVDLIGVRQFDATGISVLVAALQQAEAAGKMLTFEAMKRDLRLALEREWNRQQEKIAGPQRDWFDAAFADFCDRKPNLA